MPHRGDVGTRFLGRIVDRGQVVSLAGATVTRFKFAKPNGQIIERDGSLLTDGTDGIFKYLTVATDLDMPGTWAIQGYVELPAGKWHTLVRTFLVKETLRKKF